MSIRATKFAEVFTNFLKESPNEQTKFNGSANFIDIQTRLKYKKGETSYSKLSEIRYISVGLASSQTIRQWAEKTLPNGKILGLVSSADTLHYKTFKPLKGGLFCERIFGPLRDFECACGIQKRPTLEEYQKIVQHQPVERKFCPTCDVEYTWSIIRRYQLGYIELVTPVGHVWYSKGQPNYLSILLDWKKNDLDSFFYCTSSSTLEESLQIFNNPFRVDPGFTNPLFDVDWIDFIKPNKLKTVDWSTALLEYTANYQKLKNLQEQKRLTLKPQMYQKLNCHFLKTKLTKQNNHFNVEKFHFLQQTFNFSAKSNPSEMSNDDILTFNFSRMQQLEQIFYNILLKKAMYLVYKKTYLFAQQKVKQKLFLFSSFFEVNTNKFLMQKCKGKTTREFTFFKAQAKEKISRLKKTSTDLNFEKSFTNQMIDFQNNQQDFLSWFQKQIIQHKTQKKSQFPYKLFVLLLCSLKTKNNRKDNVVSPFLSHLTLQNSNRKNKLKKEKNFILDFNNQPRNLLKNQKLVLKHSKFRNKFQKTKNIKASLLIEKKSTIKKIVERLVKKVLFQRIKEFDMLVAPTIVLKPDLNATVVHNFFNQNLVSKLAHIGKIFANFIFYDTLKIHIEYENKYNFYLNLLTQNQILKPISQTQDLTKELKFTDFYLLRNNFRMKHLSYLLSTFLNSNFNNTENLNYLLSHINLNLPKIKNSFLLNDSNKLTARLHLRLKNAVYFSSWKSQKLLQKQLDLVITKDAPWILEELSNTGLKGLDNTEKFSMTTEKEKQTKILSFFNYNVLSKLQKKGIFYQKTTAIQNIQKLKLAQTITKKHFFWKFGFLLCTDYSRANKNSKSQTPKVQSNLNLLVTKLAQSIVLANKKPYKTSKKEVNCKSIQAYNSLIQNSDFLFLKSVNIIHSQGLKTIQNSKNKFNQNENIKIQITGQNQKLLLFQMNQSNNSIQVHLKLSLQENLSDDKLVNKVNSAAPLFWSGKQTKKSLAYSINKNFEFNIQEKLTNWLTEKILESLLHKRLLRFQYGINAFSGRKPLLRNSIYFLSAKEREFFYEEKRPVYFINYCRGYSIFDDIWLPIYHYKGLENQILTLTGAAILQRFLQEFDDLKELSKMEKQYRIDLLAIEKKIRELKILGSFFMSLDDRRKLENFIKKQVYLLRKTKLIRKLFIKQSKLSSTLLTTLPVLPPDLRPILKMQGQVAASDLNRLYQRVIYRNDRLRKLKKTSGCLPTDLKYAQRLLQEAVDNLIQNGKSGGSPEVDSRGRPLKSLSELLKGKQGRFRQNLLGKRVDYSGRSVIVVGPTLKIHECGLPKEIAVELFLPFLIQRILYYKFARTVIGAKSLIQSDSNLCSFLLAELMQSHPIYLNRAPTLHRLGIQAFQPKLIEGRAILLHPLVCPAFNADFDGDQMAVHLPLTVEARAEAWKLMLSRNHLISAGTGNPVMLPSQDMVLGCYYLTTDTLRPKVPTHSLINFIDFKTITSFYDTQKNLFINSNNLTSDFFITEKNKKQISLMLKKANQELPSTLSLDNFARKNNGIFYRYFHNFEQVIKAYQQQKLKIHSDIWVKWTNAVETFSPKSRSGKISPLEIIVNSNGSWNEIRHKHIRHISSRAEKNEILMNQYIRTTPGRILFYNLFQTCIKNS